MIIVKKLLMSSTFYSHVICLHGGETRKIINPFYHYGIIVSVAFMIHSR